MSVQSGFAVKPLSYCSTLALCSALLACGSDPVVQDGGTPASEVDSGSVEALGRRCSGTTCEALLWPRLALQLGDDRSSLEDVFFAENGREFAANTQPGCPVDWTSSAQAGPFSCVSGYSAAPSVDAVRVIVRRPSQDERVLDVSLAPHNYCAESIAYVVLALSDGELTLQGPTYRSPCLETFAD
jgi:hypothetical protein